ncbi:MAG: methyltransferase domain-containing protein [Gammaproteobacteria bacterium]|nr:methyltransferase domain-containing protein [Gammaproteobacteria bacterium]
MDDKRTLNLRDVRRRFDSAASSFDSADFVHAVTREGLFARLEPLVFAADSILDLGSATGSAERQLRKRFGRAHIVSLDVSHNMLRQGMRKRSWISRFLYSRSSSVQADASNLPFADQSIDFVFSNLLLPCVDRPGVVFAEVARVLRKDGVFAFATLGPDSLLEISRAWNSVDGHAHVNRFLDMHDIGDGLVRSGLRDPVLDVDRLSVLYRNSEKLFADLTSVGARNTLRQRNRSLVGKRRFRKMVDALNGEPDSGDIKLELELVYGHCWGGGAGLDPTGYRIDASRIPLRRG